ncbi:hypothetical protein GM418_00450 [Maribellus comscasis]|uniref:Uncharacterized protein n=1 Tax=Maribellus comscasis TaxID=2681766 RepID=A0A6I6JHA5_9BACT|nr:hypothetical protein [Maribellus comscasis]QGY42176.1 hypothetical protein GM418_00450 [Maribellus comscasis]
MVNLNWPGVVNLTGVSNYQMQNEFLIQFGGENHIRVETLTEFLEKYRFLLYRINNNLGYSTEDLTVEVSPPENGSFRIKISPKYENQLLNTVSGILGGTMSGLILAWVLSGSNALTVEDVQKIIEGIDSKQKTEITTQVYNIYQQNDVKQTINQSFEIVSKDNNIQSLDISQNNHKIISIPKSDFPKYIKPQSELIQEIIETEKTEIEQVSLIVKTVHFEGSAKWGFIWRGYPIKASLKDENFIKKLSSEAFKRGDILMVKLQKRSVYNEDLNTYIIDENRYEIVEVLNHISKNSNDENYKLSLKE